MQLTTTRLAVFIFLAAFGSTCVAADRIVTDSTGRELALPAIVKRVYAAGPPASVFVFAIAPEKLIGWTRAMHTDEAVYLPQKYAKLPEVGRLTGRGNTANLEQVLAAKPDMIVDAGSTSETYISLAQKVETQTGIPYLLFDGRLAQTAKSFRALGVALGEKARGDALANYVDRTLAELHAKIAKVATAKRPRVYYARGANGLTTALDGSINVEVLDLLNAENVAGKSKISSGLTKVSFEQILAWNPDIIVTTDEVFYRFTVHQDPRWRALAAVGAKRVYLSPDLPFGWFDFPPGPNRLIGAQWLAKILYPDIFKDDLEPKVRTFYRLFYHREPSSKEVEALLNPGNAE